MTSRALRAAEPTVSSIGSLITKELNKVLVSRGAIDQLAARAGHGDQDATRKLAHVLGDRGDADGAWRVLRAAGMDHRRRVASVHDKLVVDLDRLRIQADGGEGVVAFRLVDALVRRCNFDQLWARARAGDHGELDDLPTLADNVTSPASSTPSTDSAESPENTTPTSIAISDTNDHDSPPTRPGRGPLHALTEVRAELARRSQMSWRRWLTEGPSNDLFPAISAGILASVVVLDCAGLAISAWHDAIARSIFQALAVLIVAMVLAAVALTVSFHTQRRHNRRLAEELREREDALRPLIFPNEAEDATPPAES